MLAALAYSARAQGQAPSPLDIEKAELLAARNADEVLAKAAAAQAALRGVDAARANFFPKLSGSVSGAYMPVTPSGVTVDAGSLGTLPLWVPANQSGVNVVNGHYVYTPSASDPLTEYPVTMPAKDWTVGGYTKNSYFKGNLTFTQPLVAWGKIKAAVDLAAFEADIAEIGSAGASLDAERQANRAYFSALLSKDSIPVLQELQGLAAAILEDRKSALAEGFVTQAEVLSSTADLAALDTRLVQATEGEQSALESLGLLTGLDAGALRLTSRYREALPALSEAELKDEAARASTDAGIARARLTEAKSKLDLERGSSILLPDLSLFANVDASGQDIPFSSSSWWSNNWSMDVSIGIAANVDFFDGGASAARKKEAAADLEAARIGEAASEKAARLAVRRAIDAARGAEASLREKQAKAAWAAEALRAERAKAADQASSRAELDAMAITEASARLDLLYARYSLEESIADLERLAGKALK
jgi:outer membrane protein TolC